MLVPETEYLTVRSVLLAAGCLPRCRVYSTHCCRSNLWKSSRLVPARDVKGLPFFEIRRRLKRRRKASPVVERSESVLDMFNIIGQEMTLKVEQAKSAK